MDHVLFVHCFYGVAALFITRFINVLFLQTKNNRPMRTSQLYMQDNSTGMSTMYTMRFDSTKSLAAKRQPTVRHTANIAQKFNKHVSVLSDCRINYDQPMAPTAVAAIRAERIARDKSQAVSRLDL